jgi:predicted O-methyltransferase YrrM
VKEYGDYKYTSVSMNKDQDLIKSLTDLAAQNTIEYVIETGTHRGLGSTTMLGNAFKNSSSLKSINTIEIDFSNYSMAKKNLSQFSYVNCLYGCSLDLNDAIDYVKKDEAILHHEKYPDIFIDHSKDPINFYVNELEGRLNEGSNNIIKQFLKKLLRPNRDSNTEPSYNLLPKLIKEFYDQTMLIVLDSAGGVGHMEFQITDDLMKNKDYYILLDDTHHLKHFRGLDIIKNRGDFSIINSSDKNGWVLAQHKA